MKKFWAVGGCLRPSRSLPDLVSNNWGRKHCKGNLERESRLEPCRGRAADYFPLLPSCGWDISLGMQVVIDNFGQLAGREYVLLFPRRIFQNTQTFENTQLADTRQLSRLNKGEYAHLRCRPTTYGSRPQLRTTALDPRVVKALHSLSVHSSLPFSPFSLFFPLIFYFTPFYRKLRVFALK